MRPADTAFPLLPSLKPMKCCLLWCEVCCEDAAMMSNFSPHPPFPSLRSKRSMQRIVLNTQICSQEWMPGTTISWLHPWMVFDKYGIYKLMTDGKWICHQEYGIWQVRDLQVNDRQKMKMPPEMRIPRLWRRGMKSCLCVNTWRFFHALCGWKSEDHLI